MSPTSVDRNRVVALGEQRVRARLLAAAVVSVGVALGLGGVAYGVRSVAVDAGEEAGPPIDTTVPVTTTNTLSADPTTTTGPAPPGVAVPELRIAAVTADAVTLEWDPPAFTGDTLTLERLEPAAAPVGVAPVDGAYTDPDLDPRTVHRYRLVAQGGGGSVPSTPVEAVTAPASCASLAPPGEAVVTVDSASDAGFTATDGRCFEYDEGDGFTVDGEAVDLRAFAASIGPEDVVRVVFAPLRPDRSTFEVAPAGSEEPPASSTTAPEPSTSTTAASTID